jgi:hypothetical protein
VVTSGREPRAPASSPSRAAAGLFDALCAAIFVAVAALLCAVPAGSLYFWMKDIVSVIYIF